MDAVICGPNQYLSILIIIGNIIIGLPVQIFFDKNCNHYNLPTWSQLRTYMHNSNKSQVGNFDQSKNLNY